MCHQLTQLCKVQLNTEQNTVALIRNPAGLSGVTGYAQ